MRRHRATFVRKGALAALAAAVLLACAWTTLHATMAAAEPCRDRAATGICPASVVPDSPPALLASPVAGLDLPDAPVWVAARWKPDRPRSSQAGAATPRSPPPAAA